MIPKRITEISSEKLLEGLEIASLYYFDRDIKQPILFSQIFSTKFSQFYQSKKKTNFLLVQN